MVVEVSNLQLERAEAEGGAWAASSAAHLVVRGEEKAAAGKEVATEGAATEGAERVVAAGMEVAVRVEEARVAEGLVAVAMVVGAMVEEAMAEGGSEEVVMEVAAMGVAVMAPLEAGVEEVTGVVATEVVG